MRLSPSPLLTVGAAVIAVAGCAGAGQDAGPARQTVGCADRVKITYQLGQSTSVRTFSGGYGIPGLCAGFRVTTDAAGKTGAAGPIRHVMGQYAGVSGFDLPAIAANIAPVVLGQKPGVTFTNADFREEFSFKGTEQVEIDGTSYNAKVFSLVDFFTGSKLGRTAYSQEVLYVDNPRDSSAPLFVRSRRVGNAELQASQVRALKIEVLPPG